MRITINGEAHEIDDGATVAQAVTAVATVPSGVAVALNGDVVARGDWATTTLGEGDRVEVLTAVQGG